MQFAKLEIDGQEYVERFQVFAMDVQVVNIKTVYPQRLVLPGEANFLLKAIAATQLLGGVDVGGNTNNTVRFKFRLGNSDGQRWYMSGGIGATNERLLNTLVLGTGLFPYVLVPPIPYSAGASIAFEVEEFLSQSNFQISFAFIGSYLIPIGASQQQAAA